MDFPRYEKYKDSGVEWLGEVPEHWETGRFSRIIMAIKDGTHGTFARTSEGKPLLSAKNVQDGYIEISDEESLISEESYASIISNGFPKRGDLLLTIVGTIGRSCIYNFDEAIAFQRSVCFIRFVDRRLSKFFYYFTKSKFFQEQLVSYAKSAAQSGVYMGDVCATYVTYPNDILEQIIITNFLDRETAKIDDLITEQQKLIELLKEKRQAVVSHAVTKGLNPDVKMKDSGIEWLGEVPEHWAIMKGKHVGLLQSTPNVSEEDQIEDGGAIFYIKVDDLNTSGNIPFFRKSNYGCSELKSSFVSNALIFPKRGAAIFTNKVSILLDKALLDPNMMGWQIYSDNDLKYFYYALLLRRLDDLADTSTVPQINNKHIYPEFFPKPPTDEQEAITSFLDQETSKLDTLISEAQKAITLLQERRTALISAAVTGKIDVRGFVSDSESGVAA